MKRRYPSSTATAVEMVELCVAREQGALPSARPRSRHPHCTCFLNIPNRQNDVRRIQNLPPNISPDVVDAVLSRFLALAGDADADVVGATPVNGSSTCTSSCYFPTYPTFTLCSGLSRLYPLCYPRFVTFLDPREGAVEQRGGPLGGPIRIPLFSKIIGTAVARGERA